MSQKDKEFLQKATFIQHLLPGIEAGTYVLEAEQEIWKEKKSQKLDSTSLRRLISVDSARLSMQANLVESVYPPDISTTKGPGPFDTCLPHIILKDVPAFPWLREPTIKAQSKAPIQKKGIKHDPEIAPWLAVLIIHESDLTPENGFLFDNFNYVLSRGLKNQLVPSEAEIYDFKLKGIYDLNEIDEKDRKGKMPANCYSLFSHQPEVLNDSTDSAINLGLADKPNEACMYTTLKKDYFRKIAPTLKDLKLMAHVRQVDTSLQPRNKQAPPMQRYGVVLANRIPKEGKVLAILVSLEKLEHALPDSGLDLAEEYIRIPVLYNWQFEVGEDKSNEFEFALKTLNNTPLDKTKSTVKLQKPHLNLKDIPSSEYDRNTKDGRIKEALKKGFVPFNHITRGEEGLNTPVQTVSWYRGPLVPYRVPYGKVLFKESLKDGTAMVHSANSADQLLRYDKELNMLDTTYAAAWELGRMLCLEDKILAGEMHEWKRKNEERVISHSEASALVSHLPHLHSQNFGLKDNDSTEHSAFQKLNHLTINKLADIFEDM